MEINIFYSIEKKMRCNFPYCFLRWYERRGSESIARRWDVLSGIDRGKSLLIKFPITEVDFNDVFTLCRNCAQSEDTTLKCATNIILHQRNPQTDAFTIIWALQESRWDAVCCAMPQVMWNDLPYLPSAFFNIFVILIQWEAITSLGMYS